jgi:hypothetical protein
VAAAEAVEVEVVVVVEGRWAVVEAVEQVAAEEEEEEVATADKANANHTTWSNASTVRASTRRWSAYATPYRTSSHPPALALALLLLLPPLLRPTPPRPSWAGSSTLRVVEAMTMTILTMTLMMTRRPRLLVAEEEEEEELRNSDRVRRWYCRVRWRRLRC